MSDNTISPQGWADIALRYASLDRAAADTHLPKELREMCELTRQALATMVFTVPVTCVICRQDRGAYEATGLEISKWLDRPRGLCAKCDEGSTRSAMADIEREQATPLVRNLARELGTSRADVVAQVERLVDRDGHDAVIAEDARQSANIRLTAAAANEIRGGS